MPFLRLFIIMCTSFYILGASFEEAWYMSIIIFLLLSPQIFFFLDFAYLCNGIMLYILVKRVGKDKKKVVH